MKTPKAKSYSIVAATCVGIICLTFIASSCIPEESSPLSEYLKLPDVSYNYDGTMPEMGTLGRVLFYDKNLSKNKTVSCASCHKQAFAFADNKELSLGFENSKTSRNSMAIQDLGFDSLQLFWDGRSNDLSKMVLEPIVHPVEMGMDDIDEVIDRLEKLPYYKVLFKNAYGEEIITGARIAEALSGFVRSITSSDVFFDSTLWHLQGEEKYGATLFVTKYQCNSCHQLSDPHGYVNAGTFANIGLDAMYADNGLASVTGMNWDVGKFKIPSLRNVALTAPYMHDGRFQTLEEVLDHYSNGIQSHPNLDSRLSNADRTPKVFSISPEEKKAIITFLNTLTSEVMTSDVKFSDPFKK